MNKELIDKIIDYNYGEFGTEFGDALVDLKNKNIELEKRVDFLIDRNDKKEEVLDKIKEYIKEDKNCIPKHISDYILELLEEIE